jgi:hypothetical protein
VFRRYLTLGVALICEAIPAAAGGYFLGGWVGALVWAAGLVGFLALLLSGLRTIRQDSRLIV